MNIYLALPLSLLVIAAAPVILYGAGLVVAFVAFQLFGKRVQQRTLGFYFGGLFLIPNLWAASIWPVLLGLGASALSPIGGYAALILLAGPMAMLVSRSLNRGMMTLGGFRSAGPFSAAVAANTALILYAIYRLNLFSRT
nr:hypothetical protein [uncultured Sphingomonas sp.]